MEMGCMLAFHHTIIDTTNLKGGKVCFSLQLLRSELMIEKPFQFGSMPGQCAVAGSPHGWDTKERQQESTPFLRREHFWGLEISPQVPLLTFPCPSVAPWARDPAFTTQDFGWWSRSRLKHPTLGFRRLIFIPQCKT